MQTKSAARNIFYGGSVFFLVILIGLVVHSHLYIINESTDSTTLTASVERGKRIWEDNACINCHTLLGEGAYFAPELGDVCKRFGGADYGGAESIAAFIAAQPSGIEGRRQMPNFNLSEDELVDIANFLCWAGTIDTKGWPPRGSQE
ncbi:MAG: cytochrome c [Rhodospirillales bacterium]|nr:cytochrome c [Rhodospirillales bacterium]